MQQDDGTTLVFPEGTPHWKIQQAEREVALWRTRNAEAASAMTDLEIFDLLAREAADRQTRMELDDQRRALVDQRERNAKHLATVPRMYRDAVADHPKMLEWIDSLVELAGFPATLNRSIHRQHGNSVMLFGPTGIGKTWQALGVPAAMAARDASADHLFLRAVDYLDGMQNGSFAEKERTYERAFAAQLLILDDLFAGGDHRRSQSDLYRLLDARFLDERPTILTTNLVGKTLSDALGERLTDRLKQSVVFVRLDGESRRAFRAVEADMREAPTTAYSSSTGWRELNHDPKTGMAVDW